MNRFVITISLLICWIAAGCHSQRHLAPEDGNPVFASLNRNPVKGILVISDAYGEQAWYETLENRPAGVIQTTPKTSAYTVWQIQISPGDTYLAVLSEGEGHPVVDIFEIERIFSRTKNPEKVLPLLSIDPYPGTIWINGWQGDTLLAIKSDVPLDLLNKEAGRVLVEEPGSEIRQFLWDVSTGTIRGE